MKTSAAILQEMMVKLGQVPQYECIAQTGPPHQPVFEYCCIANGQTVTVRAKSKKEAKQKAASIMLTKLAACGLQVPSTEQTVTIPFPASSLLHDSAEPKDYGKDLPDQCRCDNSSKIQDSEPSYVSCLNEFQVEHGLPAVDYKVTAVSGPPHLRQFTISVSLSGHERQATSSTKKLARQLAAKQLYTFLKHNLSKVTESQQKLPTTDALEKAIVDHMKALQIQPRIFAVKKNTMVGQPCIDPLKQSLALSTLEGYCDREPHSALAAVTRVLGLSVQLHSLPSCSGALTVLELSPISPPIAVAARNMPAAVVTALRYLRNALEMQTSYAPKIK
ncbi:RISC-loading complex subunit TARBP2-like isoform X2 [Battus philenor]|uniref:RISC-loading complex subunit TARBP2-like isoform X2 n=1 Tax=Battus philenor TaxID=42288 RepID=UPI0035D0D878